MGSNLDKYKEDLDRLSKKGDLLIWAMQYECFPEQFEESMGDRAAKVIEILPRFEDDYQAWYSEAKAAIKQLLPERSEDFDRHYQKPKNRKDITYDSYRIEDYLQGLTVTKNTGETVVSPKAAIPQFKQQVAILKSAQARLESSLFDIRQLVQADLFDSELSIADELKKQGFRRAAGAIAGVVLEKHLGLVIQNHNLKSRKKNPTIGDLNDILKENDVLEVPTWRNVQRLADLRNLCDHNKEREPTAEEVSELIDGVGKISKTLF